MTPLEALMHLRHAWQQEPQRARPLTVCPACRDCLLNELDAIFPLPGGRGTRELMSRDVMGFTFEDGPVETCALHPLLHEKDAACP